MKPVLTFIGLIACGLVFAGSEIGNGGYSIVCRDNKGPITSAEVLDIYEGRLLFKRTYGTQTASVDELVQMAQNRVQQHPHFAMLLRKELNLIAKNSVFIPEGNVLEPTRDHLPTIKKRGCEFGQLANWTHLGELIISQEIYDRLDNLNKASLIVHEAVYAIRRKAIGDKESPLSRRLVAHLMSENLDEEALSRFIAESLPSKGRKRACGLNGSLEERLEHCSYVEAPNQHFHLVTRTSDMKEVWLDKKAKLLWGDRFPRFMNLYEAEGVCHSVGSEMGNMTEFQWRLPLIEEFADLGQYATSLIPNLSSYNTNYMFWTSSTRNGNAGIYTYSETNNSVTYSFFKKISGSARCVAPI